MEQPKSALSRSSSRKKRSTTNLSNLRLAPLSTRFSDSHTGPRTAPISPYESDQTTSDAYFNRQHSSYLQGKSAPSTPGILSRNSSRTQLGGGLSRRGDLYDDTDNGYEEYAYGAVPSTYGQQHGALRAQGHIPKAKSEGGLAIRHHVKRPSGHGIPIVKSSGGKLRSGTSTPKGTKKNEADEDDWLTRTGAATSAMLQESKGQSWYASRESQTSLNTAPDSTDEEADDDGYEEMAALSAMSSNTAKMHSAESPESPRMSRWGSRYGSRTGSRRTSRRGSVTGGRTPLATTGIGQDSYFDRPLPAIQDGNDDVIPKIDVQSPDEEDVAKLTSAQSFGLGGMVDRFMGFNIFQGEEKEDTTEDEGEKKADETEEQAKARMAAETKRKKDEKEKLVAAKPLDKTDFDEAPQQSEGGWKDAAWLLSVASKAMF